MISMWREIEQSWPIQAVIKVPAYPVFLEAVLRAEITVLDAKTKTFWALQCGSLVLTIDTKAGPLRRRFFGHGVEGWMERGVSERGLGRMSVDGRQRKVSRFVRGGNVRDPAEIYVTTNPEAPSDT